VLHFLPEVQDVPLQRAVLLHRFVREPVDLANAEHTVVERAEHRPPAFGAEIEREEAGGHGLTAA
jgi:hypothetical protein